MKIYSIPHYTYNRLNTNRQSNCHTPVSFGAVNPLSEQQITKLAKYIMDIPNAPYGRFQFDLITFDLIAKRNLKRLSPEHEAAFMDLFISKALPDNIQTMEDSLRRLGPLAVTIMDNHRMYKVAETKAKSIGNLSPVYELANGIKNRVVAELNIGQAQDCSASVSEIFIEQGLKRNHELLN